MESFRGAGGKKLVEKECLRKFKRISALWRMFSLSTDYIDHVYIVHVGNMLEEYFEKATRAEHSIRSWIATRIKQ